jgi:hypothetical protein
MTRGSLACILALGVAMAGTSALAQDFGNPLCRAGPLGVFCDSPPPPPPPDFRSGAEPRIPQIIPGYTPPLPPIDPVQVDGMATACRDIGQNYDPSLSLQDVAKRRAWAYDQLTGTAPIDPVSMELYVKIYQCYTAKMHEWPAPGSP